MIAHLHRLSAICFYVLGGTFFLAYLMMRNGIAANASAVWMQVADLPFALSAFTFGGLSFYRSLSPDKESKNLGMWIGIPLGVFFLILIVLNFWGVWPFN